MRHLRDPVGVDASQRLACRDTFLGLEGTDEDTVRSEQVVDGSSLGKELRVGEDIEPASWLGVCLEDSSHGLGGSAWHGGLLNDDLGGGSDLGDTAGCEFDVAIMIEIVSFDTINRENVRRRMEAASGDALYDATLARGMEGFYGGHSLEVSGETSTDTALLGGGVDTDEDEIGLLDTLIDISGEEEVATTRLADDILEAGFVDRKLEVGAVPGVDTGLVQVDDCDGDVGALEGDDSAGGTA